MLIRAAETRGRFPAKNGGRTDSATVNIVGPAQGRSEGMERHELRELVEDALEALKTRYQRTRTPFNLQTIREEVEDQHGVPLADDDAAQIPGIMQRLGSDAGG